MIYLELKAGVLSYKRGNYHLVVGVSSSLLEIVRIKEFDMGYIVVDARYVDSIVEDYIDLDWSLSLLGLSKLRDKYFKGVRGDDICVKNQ